LVAEQPRHPRLLAGIHAHEPAMRPPPWVVHTRDAARPPQHWAVLGRPYPAPLPLDEHLRHIPQAAGLRAHAGHDSAWPADKLNDVADARRWTAGRNAGRGRRLPFVIGQTV